MNFSNKNSRGFTRTNVVSKHSRGFTLIELLVVISIIGLLSSVVFASLQSARTRARDTKRIADLKQLDLAIRLYRDNSSTQGYPVCGDDVPISNTSCLGSVLVGAGVMPTIPSDPTNSGNNRYQYWSDANHFSIRTRFEGKPLRFTHTYPGYTTPASCDGITLTQSTGAYAWYQESVYPDAINCSLQWVQHSDHP